MSEFDDFIKETFAPYGEIRIRKMFGGAGVYVDDLFFAIIADEVVFLKADRDTFALFEDAGCERFTVEMKGKTGSMNYYTAPEEIYENGEALDLWARRAVDAALRAAKKKKPKNKATTKRNK